MHAWIAQEFERRVMAGLERWVQEGHPATKATEGHLQAGLRQILLHLAEEIGGDPGKILERYTFQIDGLVPHPVLGTPPDGNVQITIVDSKAHLHPDDKLWEDRACWGPEVQYRGGRW